MYLQSSNQEKVELGFGGHSCHWGTHIAGLYESEEERSQIITGFLQKGLELDNIQRYCLEDKIDQNIRERILSNNPELKDKIENPKYMATYSPKDLYYPDGQFSPERMDEGLNMVFQEVQNEEPGKIRAFAEMSWALDNVPGVDQLMVYEAKLNHFVHEKPWISICLYDLTRFSGEVIMEVFRTHPFVINKGVVTENPFYTEPDQWLSEKGYI